MDAGQTEQLFAGPATERLAATLGDGWRVSGSATTSTGFPSLDVQGPAFEDGRSIYVQVETPRGGDGTRFAAAIGTVVDGEDLDVQGAEAPPWVERARLIGDFLEDHWDGTPYRVSRRSAPRTKGGEETAKAAIALRHGLPLHWAKGYADSYLGVRTEPFPADQLGAFLEVLGEVLPDLHRCLQTGEC